MERQLTGLSGWVADVIAAFGAWGVGLLTLLETVFPPIPSEVILPLAGYLAERGRMELGAVLAAATVGGVGGAFLLYEATRRLGAERSTALVASCRWWTGPTSSAPSTGSGATAPPLCSSGAWSPVCAA